MISDESVDKKGVLPEVARFETQKWLDLGKTDALMDLLDPSFSVTFTKDVKGEKVISGGFNPDLAYLIQQYLSDEDTVRLVQTNKEVYNQHRLMLAHYLVETFGFQDKTTAFSKDQPTAQPSSQPSATDLSAVQQTQQQKLG